MTIWARAGMAALVVCALASVELRAQSFAAFGFRSINSSALTVPSFSDDEVGGFLKTLDGLLASPRHPNADADARNTLWQFARRLQSGVLSPPQETRILTHLDRVAAKRPGTIAAVTSTRRMINQLMVGKTAPDIIGSDLQGRPLKL